MFEPVELEERETAKGMNKGGKKGEDSRLDSECDVRVNVKGEKGEKKEKQKEKAFFLRLKEQPHYSLDVRCAKYHRNADVLVWWSHRGLNQQFVVNEDNTISPAADPGKALGFFHNNYFCDETGATKTTSAREKGRELHRLPRDPATSLGLVLVAREDEARRLVFKGLHGKLFSAGGEKCEESEK